MSLNSETLPPLGALDFATLVSKSGKASGTLLFSSEKSTVACDWYWIDCGFDGIDDWCCASFNSCADYCSDLCGGECEYVPN